MKIAIQTLGCKVNQSESASMEGILRANNYQIVRHTDSPDVCIVNTCTVTAKSDYQSRQLIRKAVRSGARVIATGCYAQLRPDELTRINGIDLVVGNSGKDDIVSYLRNLSGSGGNPSVIAASQASPLKIKPYFSGRSRAFLKIQDGCNSSCSYCTVPMARGKSRSLCPPDVLKAVERLAADGYREIVLTGIHIGSYGLDLRPESSLVDIVDSIVGNYPGIRIRLSSVEPQEFREELLAYIKEGRVCRHLHIPLQSGSDRILRAMNRGYTVGFFKQLIHRISSECPDISIGTDVIAGFPGETVKDFDDTVRLIEELPFSYLHVFPFSKRPQTGASLSANQIKDSVKKERVKTLISIGKNKKNIYMAKHLGSVLNVIVEKKNITTGFYNAISDNYLRLLVRSDTLQPGRQMQVRVISLTDAGLIAEPL